MASRTLTDAWNDFDSATKNVDPALIENLKNSSTRWTLKQIDLILELMSLSNPTKSPNTSSKPLPSSTTDSPKFGTVHNALLWAGFSESELLRIDNQDMKPTILVGNLDFNVPFRIDLDGEGNLVKTVAPGTATQSVWKKKFDSHVRTLQTFVMPHDRIYSDQSDSRFLDLLRILNIPIRVI